ncbi:MAG: VCBS repeat-containing protein [Chloroflexi bacterium]|nr:VCBS repeat-containing protein [Chloroflexota bacterium]
MADAVLFHPTNGVKVALSNGNGFDAPSWWTQAAIFKKLSYDAFPRLLADVNGDGRADAVVFHPTKGVKVALSKGGRFGSPVWWSQHALFKHPSQDRRPRLLADMNGDGKVDAVLFHETQGVYVALSNGTRFGKPQLWSNSGAFAKASQKVDPRLLADVNGDGMADAVVLDHAQGIVVALSTGGGFGQPTVWNSEAAFKRTDQDEFPRWLADANGDGMADAILFHPTNGIRVALSTGTSFAPSTWWTQHNAWDRATFEADPRLPGDVNGDGAADAVLFHQTKGIRVGLAVE